MTFFMGKLEAHLAWVNKVKKPDPKLTFNRLHFLAEIPSGHFSLWKKPKPDGGRLPTDAELDRLSKVEILGLGLDELLSWRALDEYDDHLLLSALDSIPHGRFIELMQKALKPGGNWAAFLELAYSNPTMLEDMLESAKATHERKHK